MRKTQPVSAMLGTWKPKMVATGVFLDVHDPKFWPEGLLLPHLGYGPPITAVHDQGLNPQTERILSIGRTVGKEETVLLASRMGLVGPVSPEAFTGPLPYGSGAADSYWWQFAWLRFETTSPAQGQQERPTDSLLDEFVRLFWWPEICDNTLPLATWKSETDGLQDLSWPLAVLDPIALLRFAGKHGPLYQDPLSWGYMNFAESAADWFRAVRRITAIRLLAELAAYESGQAPLDDTFRRRCRQLLRCAYDLRTYQGKQRESNELTWWNEGHEGNRPQWFVRAIREGRIPRGYFSNAAKLAYSESARQDGKHFRFKIEFQETAGIQIEAWTLLGVIYAQLYDQLAGSKNPRICPHCGKLFTGRADKRTCDDHRCRKAFYRAHINSR